MRLLPGVKDLTQFVGTFSIISNAQNRNTSIVLCHYMRNMNTPFLTLEIRSQQRKERSVLKGIIIILSSLLLQCKMNAETVFSILFLFLRCWCTLGKSSFCHYLSHQQQLQNQKIKILYYTSYPTLIQYSFYFQLYNILKTNKQAHKILMLKSHRLDISHMPILHSCRFWITRGIPR